VDCFIFQALNAVDMGDRKNMNLPMCEIKLPALSEQDKKDLMFGVEQGTWSL
jgi:pyruvate kinase